MPSWARTARASRGLFLGFQHPEEIPGVSVLNFLRQAMSARKGIEDFSVLEVRMAVLDWAKRLGMDSRFIERYLNEGFSGGEKKRNEILQMAVMEPDFAVLDETDSGLDIDALGVVARGIDAVREARPQLGILLITHYRRILEHLTPDAVHILLGGRIVASGGRELADRLEREGFDAFRAAEVARCAPCSTPWNTTTVTTTRTSTAASTRSPRSRPRRTRVPGRRWRSC